MNEMRFPAAFLQGIYYNSRRPQYLNFGGIGSLIGHEMTHGFDRQGRNFDEKGKEYSQTIFSSNSSLEIVTFRTSSVI